MKNKLISIGERNQQLDEKYIKSKSDYEFFAFGNYHKYSMQYTEFCYQPLNLGMLAPAIEVNGKWEVLDHPPSCDRVIYETDFCQCDLSKIEQFQQAKDKVIFEGFEVRVTSYNNKQAMFKDGIYFCAVNNLLINYKTIQDLIKYAPTLTEYGKQISGLDK